MLQMTPPPGCALEYKLDTRFDWILIKISQIPQTGIAISLLFQQDHDMVYRCKKSFQMSSKSESNFSIIVSYYVASLIVDKCFQNPLTTASAYI